MVMRSHVRQRDPATRWDSAANVHFSERCAILKRSLIGHTNNHSLVGHNFDRSVIMNEMYSFELEAKRSSCHPLISSPLSTPQL